MGVRAWGVAGLVALGGLAGAGGASADTTIVGEVTLTPNSGLAISTGENIPVFQGDASGNYVLSSPQTGTITLWSFLSAGVATGKQFVLRVLAPVGAGGTDWKAVATSAPVAVTSATGVDGVNGPFTASIAITAGDRIALQPVDDSSLPTEPGMIGQDGIRYFGAPFDDGSSATIAPGSGMDNGQVVPIQATVQYTPTLVSLTPPSVGHYSSPVASVKYGEIVSCRPGTYNESPTTHKYSWFWTETTYVRKGAHGLPEAEVSETGLNVSGQNVTLPDLPAFPTSVVPDHDTSTISCEDSAGFDGQTLDVGSAPVRVLPVKPVLALRKVSRGRKPPVSIPVALPGITKGVGAGGTNSCSHGDWLHFPGSYKYAWFAVTLRQVADGTLGPLLHVGQTFKPTTDDEGERIECVVHAVNAAGVSGGAISNNYVVPATAPRATSAPVVTMSTDDPHRDQVAVTAGTHAVLPGYGNSDWAYYTTIAEKIYLGCDPGGWNRNDLSFRTNWFVNGQAIDITGDTIGNDYVSISDPYELTETVLNTSTLRFNFAPDNTQEPTLFNGTVSCTVIATTPQGRQSASTSLPLRIWNGCDVGIEPWDQKILRNGPLCDDYAPYYNNSELTSPH